MIGLSLTCNPTPQALLLVRDAFFIDSCCKIVLEHLEALNTELQGEKVVPPPIMIQHIHSKLKAATNKIQEMARDQSEHLSVAIEFEPFEHIELCFTAPSMNHFLSTRYH
jgi:hypothetical protein